MKNIIYQYWKGDLKPGVVYSTELIKKYAEKIGAEYRFDHNKTIAGKVCSIPIYYEPANPLVDPYFDDYDNVALIDIDVFPVENLNENLFDQLDGEDAGICTEPDQPFFRSTMNVSDITYENDMRWARFLKDKWNVKYSYDEKDRPMVYNTGVVVISKEGLRKMKTQWPSFQEYVNSIQNLRLARFYYLFQDYFSAFIHMDGFKFKKLHNGWNSYMHKLRSHPNATINDTRTEDTKLVHIMFRTADDWPRETLWAITNSPMEEWRKLVPVWKEWPNDPEKPIQAESSLVSSIKNIQEN